MCTIFIIFAKQIQIMKKYLVLLLSFLFSCTLSYSQEDYDVYLLIGQSNAVGFAPLEKGDEDIVEGVYVLDSLGKAIPFGGVLNRFSSLPKLGNRMGYSLGVSFAKTMHSVTGRKILMVSNAKGATSISQWLPDAKDPLFYNEAVRRTLQAKQYGPIKGILWHQACGDARWTGQYAVRAKKLFSSLRRDLGDDKIPVVVGEAGHWLISKDGTVTCDKINEVLRGLPNTIPNLLCVTSEDCTPIYDNIHFDHKSLELLGCKYASKILSMGQGIYVETSGEGRNIFTADDNWYFVYARPDGQNAQPFKVKFNQQVLSREISSNGGKWTFAGRIYLKAGTNKLILRNTGSGKCGGAVWITSHPGSFPPVDNNIISFFRNENK